MIQGRRTISNVTLHEGHCTHTTVHGNKSSNQETNGHSVSVVAQGQGALTDGELSGRGPLVVHNAHFCPFPVGQQGNLYQRF